MYKAPGQGEGFILTGLLRPSGYLNCVWSLSHPPVPSPSGHTQTWGCGQRAVAASGFSSTCGSGCRHQRRRALFLLWLRHGPQGWVATTPQAEGSSRSRTGSAGPAESSTPVRGGRTKRGTNCTRDDGDPANVRVQREALSPIPRSRKGRFAYSAASLWGKMNSNVECFTMRVLPNYALSRALNKQDTNNPLGSQTTRV